MKTFKEWLKQNEEATASPYTSIQPATPATQLAGIPPAITARLQSLGPNMNTVMQNANKMLASKVARDMTQALSGALGEYDAQQKQQQQGQTVQAAQTPRI